jgi:arylformamidase
VSRRARWIDLTRPITQDMTVYPGDPRPRIRTTRGADGIAVTDFLLRTHSGTHVDLPGHLYRRAVKPDPEKLWKALIGPARLVDLSAGKGTRPSRPGRIAHAGSRAPEISLGELRRVLGDRAPLRLLIRTGATARTWRGLSSEAARWLSMRTLVVGTDALSIDPPRGTLEAHRVFLQVGVLVIEGLRLDGVGAGSYDLVALPLHLAAPDGAPVRALARRRPTS